MIKNITAKTIISTKEEHLITTAQKALGLMFSKKPKALIFYFNKEQKIGIHMMFVFFPIDIIFLDKGKKVVELKQELKPWQLYTSDKKAKYFIELPAGTIRRTKTKKSHKIEF